jgi:hypothetical protein
VILAEKIIKSLPKGNNLVFRDIKADGFDGRLEEMYQLSNNMKFCLVKSPIV